MGCDRELWHTEWGYRRYWPGLKNASGYIARNPSRLHPAPHPKARVGVEHSFIYDFKDDGTDPYSDYQNFGLVKSDLSPKESFFAVQRLSGLLAGMRVAAPEKQAQIETDSTPKQGLGPQCYTFASPEGQKTAVGFWEAKPWDRALPLRSSDNLAPGERTRPPLSLRPFFRERDPDPVEALGQRQFQSPSLSPPLPKY